MAGSRKIVEGVTQRVFTEKKDGLICILWGGEFGHLLMNVMPRVNAMRLEKPNHHIIFASYEGDDIYFVDNEGKSTIDEYWSFPWWPTDRGCHEVKGNRPKVFETILNQFSERAKDYPEFEMYDTTRYDLAQFTMHFKNKNRIAYPFKAQYANYEKEDLIAPEPHIVIYARAKNYSQSRFRSWNTHSWKKFLDMVLDYDKEVTAYVCGVKDESILFDWNDRIIPVLEGPTRASVTMQLLATAKYCISDCSGSGNYALQVGTPTFVSGPPEYEEGFTHSKNYFGTYIYYQNADMASLTSDVRMEAFKKFFDGITYDLKRSFYVFTPPK